MSRLFIYIVLLTCFSSQLISQDIFSIHSADSNLRWKNLVELTNFGSPLTSGENPSIAVLNVERNNLTNSVAFLNLDPQKTTNSGTVLFGQRSNLEATLAQQSANEIFVCGSLNQSAIFISSLDQQAKQLNFSRLYQVIDGNTDLVPKAMLFSNSKNYLLCNGNISGQTQNYFSICCLLETGQIEWSKKYVFASNQKLLNVPSQLILSSDGHLVISILQTDSLIQDTNVYLIKINIEDGQILLQREVEFQTPNRIKLNPSKHFLQSNGSNIHLMTDFEIIGSNMLFVTMFDQDLNLRTWRNYPSNHKIFDFQIGGGKFLFSALHESKDGFQSMGLLGINNLNAIPEIIDYYPFVLSEQYKMRSSHVSFNRLTRTYQNIGFFSHDKENQLVFYSRGETATGKCINRNQLIAAKDPIVIEEGDFFKTSDIKFEFLTLNLFLENENISLERLCNSTNTLDRAGSDIKIFQISKDFVQINGFLGPSYTISAYNLNGQQIFTQQITGNNPRFQVSEWPTGTYIIKVSSNLDHIAIRLNLIE